MLYILLSAFVLFYALSLTPFPFFAVIGFNFTVDKIVVPLIKPAILLAVLVIILKSVADHKFKCPWKPCSGLVCLSAAWKAGVQEYKKCIAATRAQKAKEAKEEAKDYIKESVENVNEWSVCSCDAEESESDEPQVKAAEKLQAKLKPKAKGKIIAMDANPAVITNLSLVDALGSAAAVGCPFLTKRNE